MKKILSLTLVVVMLMSAFVYAQASTLHDGGARTAAESAASDRTHADSKEDAKVVSTAEPCDSAKQLPQDDINMRKTCPKSLPPKSLISLRFMMQTTVLTFTRR